MSSATMTDRDLARKSIEYRRDTVRAIMHAGAGHTGGSLSCIDILNVLYNRVLRITPQNWAAAVRDRYVQSKGHSVEALYVVLADRGFFPKVSLDTLCHYRSPFIGHPTRKVPGIEMNTGGLGHGLPICVGMALAANRDGHDVRVVTLLGDGELAEGSNWEAAMAAAHHRLDNLLAIVDHNALQITGPTRDVCSNEPLDAKFAAFGWDVRRVDGHDLTALEEAFARPGPTGVPVCVIADTVKGRGVSFMENVLKWHHGVPSAEEFARAEAEFERQLAAWEAGA